MYHLGDVLGLCVPVNTPHQSSGAGSIKQVVTNIPFSSSVQMAAEEEIERLRRQLREKDEQVHLAAQAGLDLLNQQMELQSRLEEQRVEMTNALEV